nr:MAG TPA: SecE/Sec61-gamma subunits of protein translocation complex [Caudoviricetes sp.]
MFSELEKATHPSRNLTLFNVLQVGGLQFFFGFIIRF